MLQAGEILDVRIEKETGTGDGVARVGSLVVFVRGGAAGDACRCEITRRTSRAAWARILAVTEPSPHRIAPDCPLAGRCGGCALRHVTETAERAAKAERVADALRRIGGAELVPEEILWEEGRSGWRNKARLYYRDGVLGFCEEGTHRPVGGPCPALCDTGSTEAIRAAAERFFRENGLSPDGLLLRLSVRYGDALACAVGELPNEYASAFVKTLRAAASRLTGVAVCPMPRGAQTLGAGARMLWGAPDVRERLFDREFTVAPAAFFQVNTRMAERLYDRVRAYAALRPGETVLDLYCGIGAIGLCVTPPGVKLFGAEIVPEAVRCARENAARFGVDAEFILGDAAEAAAELSRRGVRPDAVLVDPPRKGLSEELCALLVRMAPGRIVYVSCDPATLSRDVTRLAPAFRPVRCTAADLFPGTSHVETVVLMAKTERKES